MTTFHKSTIGVLFILGGMNEWVSVIVCRGMAEVLAIILLERE